MIINLKLNLGDGSLYGNAITNNESSFEINIQEGIDSTTIIPDELNVNPGQAGISFNTENGKRVLVTSNVKKRKYRYDSNIHKFRYSRRINKEHPSNYGDTIRFRESLNLLIIHDNQMTTTAV